MIGLVGHENRQPEMLWDLFQPRSEALNELLENLVSTAQHLPQ